MQSLTAGAQEMPGWKLVFIFMVKDIFPVAKSAGPYQVPFSLLIKRTMTLMGLGGCLSKILHFPFSLAGSGG